MIYRQLPLRRAVPADAAAIRSLTRTAYAKWVPIIGREPRPMTADYESAVRQHIIDLVESDGGIVGLIELDPQPSFLLIVNIAVHPERQSAGLGDLLLRHAEARARSLGLGELQLYTNAAFAANLRFYSRRGFQESGREPFPGGGETVYMRKEVAR